MTQRRTLPPLALEARCGLAAAMAPASPAHRVACQVAGVVRACDDHAARFKTLPGPAGGSLVVDAEALARHLANAAYLARKTAASAGLRVLCLPPRLERLLALAAERLCCAVDYASLRLLHAEAFALVAAQARARDITRAEADSLRALFDKLAGRPEVTQ